jgi:hypothetical protein
LGEVQEGAVYRPVRLSADRGGVAGGAVIVPSASALTAGELQEGAVYRPVRHGADCGAVAGGGSYRPVCHGADCGGGAGGGSLPSRPLLR